MFSEKLEALLPELRAYARMLCRDVTRSDDLVQNACLKAWQHQDDFDPEKGPLRAWMFRILRNDFYQQRRVDIRSETREQEEIEAQLVADCNLEQRSSLTRMLQAVDSLKRVQREAFLLVVAAGFTYEEAAKVLRCSEGTVKSRVSRAREMALGRYHSEQSMPETKPQKNSPIDDLHDALNRIQLRYSAA